MKKHRPLDPGPSFGRLALGLAAALYLSMVSPALADFQTAVAAYEREAYKDAKTEFETLATAGDERAGPYLEMINQKLMNEGEAAGSFFSSLSDSLSSIMGGSDTSRDTGSSGAGPMPEGASGSRPSDGEPGGHGNPDTGETAARLALVCRFFPAGGCHDGGLTIRGAFRWGSHPSRTSSIHKQQRRQAGAGCSGSFLVGDDLQGDGRDQQGHPPTHEGRDNEIGSASGTGKKRFGSGVNHPG